jgi:micrococcal nuclease
MLRRHRDRIVHRGRVVDLSESLRRRGSQARIARSAPGTVWRPWKGVGLVALLSLAAMLGREGLDPLGARDWFAGGASPPIRAAINVAAGRPDCRVARVIDGDTVDLHCPGDGRLRARLLGFDTPEVFSPECPSELARGTAATQALERKIRASREIRVALRGADHYGRRLAHLSLDGRDVAGSMIAEGLPRSYYGGARRSWCR